MSPDDVARNGEPEAGAGITLRVKGLPDPLPFGRRDARSIVDHLDDRGISIGKDPNLQPRVRPMFQGVVDEVRQRFPRLTASPFMHTGPDGASNEISTSRSSDSGTALISV